MPRKRHGIYFDRKTKEIVSIDGHVNGLDLKGWVKISDNPTLRLLVVRELLTEKRLVKNGSSVYWSGFRGSGSESDGGWAVGLTFLTEARRESDLKSLRKRRGGVAAPILGLIQRLLRSIFGSRTAF